MRGGWKRVISMRPRQSSTLRVSPPAHFGGRIASTLAREQIEFLKFVWDNQKNLLNQAKHKVSFEIAQLVFNDPFHLSIPDRYDHDEE